MNRKKILTVFGGLLCIAALIFALPGAVQGNISGAIFTTLENGSGVNVNLFDNKCDVFLNGGPPPNAPCASAGLPDGCYVYQVTAPPGGGLNETLLSQDSIVNRFVQVSGGVFVHDDGTCANLAAQLTDCLPLGTGTPDPCTPTVDVVNPGGSPLGHDVGTGKCPGAISVRLEPFADTPNNGGVYKVYATPVEDYDNTCQGVFGFNHDNSKTDNFRVKPSASPPSLKGEIDVFKFCDANANGILDPTELTFGLQGWQIDVTNSSSCSGTTDVNGLKACPNLDPDTYNVSETVKTDFKHTATCVDGSCGTGACSVTTSTPCTGDSDCPTGEKCIVPPPGSDSVSLGQVNDGDVRHVDFGNVGLSTISGRKFSDLDASGSFTNPPDTGLPGVRILLSGTAANGASVSDCKITDANGLYSFTGLLPGTYTITEDTPPAGSIATTPTSCENITLEPDLTRHCSVTTTTTCTSDSDCPFVDDTHETCGAPTCAGTPGTCNIGNVCKGAGGGLTLGFWSNKNGYLAMHDGGSVGPELALLSGLCLRNGNGTNFDPNCYCASGACPPGVTADCTGSPKYPFRTWLLSANATNMAYMLSAQLAAMELNVEAGFVNGGAFVFAGTAPAGCTVPGLNGNGFISINNLMADANTELCADGITLAGNPDRACQEFKKNALDAANNNKNFAVACTSPNASCP